MVLDLTEDNFKADFNSCNQTHLKACCSTERLLSRYLDLECSDGVFLAVSLNHVERPSQDQTQSSFVIRAIAYLLEQLIALLEDC